MSRLLVLLVVPLWLFGGCAAPKEFPAHPRLTPPNTARVWTVSNGFHTSIAVRAKDAPADIRALDPQARYFVIGWGARDFYMGNLRYPWEYLRTVFLPEPSTVHLMPIRTNLLEECPNAEIVEFEVKPSGLRQLRDRLEADFHRDDHGQFVVFGPGRLPLSRFYQGTETYFLPKTCNMWVASRLKTAGVPMTVGVAVSAGNLSWQSHRQGRVLSTLKRPREVL